MIKFLNMSELIPQNILYGNIIPIFYSYIMSDWARIQQKEFSFCILPKSFAIGENCLAFYIIIKSTLHCKMENLNL